MTNSESRSQLDDEISLLDLWLILRKEWVTIAGTTVAGIVIEGGDLSGEHPSEVVEAAVEQAMPEWRPAPRQEGPIHA